ncbi:DprA-like winged helix domain-containing protein [Microbacterium maritypicum]
MRPTCACSSASIRTKTRLLDALSSRVTLSAAELARRCGLAVDRVSSLLGILELGGEVERSERGWIRRRRHASRS